MSRPLRAAASLLRAVACCLLLTASATTARAQVEDPFALPDIVSLDDATDLSGPGLVAVELDGVLLDRFIALAWQDGVLTIDAEAARAAAIPVPEGRSGYVAVADLAVASWNFDRQTQTLAIKRFRRGDGPNDIDFARREAAPGDFVPMFAGLMDYDLTATFGAGTVAAGFFSPRAVYGEYELGTSLQWVSKPSTGIDGLIRLDTALRHVSVRRGINATLGDYVSAGSRSQRPLRMAGVQVATDMALRPDLVTYPLPGFAGQVAVPTAIDLIVNDRRFSGGELEAGEFQISNIPVNPGRGEVSVVVQDALGREVVQTARIYVSRELVPVGRWQAGVNAGFIRRNFGRESSDYRDLALTWFGRRGMSRALSLGFSGEVGAGIANIGLQAEQTIGGAAMVFAEARLSTGRGSGSLIRAGVESIGRGISGRVEAIVPTGRYADLAAASGDDLPPRQYNASLAFDVSRASQLQFAASRIERRGDDPRFTLQERRIDLLRSTFRMPLSKSLDVFADVSRRRGDRTSYGAMVGLSLQLSRGRHAQASAARESGQTTAQASFFRPDVVPGEIGYGIEATKSIVERFAARGSYRSEYGRAEIQAETVAGRSAARLNARGTVIATGGTVFARNQTGGSFAFVKTGSVAGVTVTREHRLAGVTDRKGRLLVEEVTPMVPIQFDIDPEKLPDEAVARSTYKRVAIVPGAVGRVDIDVRAWRSVPLLVAEADGTVLPLGTKLTAASGDSYMVAYDGLMDFNRLSADRKLEAKLADGRQCEIAVPPLSDTPGIAQALATCR
ncbi:fimbria/pilus outer membrane usher protein [Croceicoccus sp. BE223]|uniref:fimbria/pilus outer membrane usher protein n=1 Tax=Croceicoccus sp. BE223 TaxID=2817716 RepID=UPI00285B2C63|nr:fimbria/pilus outer membrane usher protein [Croceicoccus sp. BE223]MDR7101351.1 outer membrane usher protein FimD/PapC [Croceicoccus sp. BE223]